MLWVSNCELGGVDPNRNTAGAGVAVVTGQRHLATFIELAVGIECQWVSRDGNASAQDLLDIWTERTT